MKTTLLIAIIFFMLCSRILSQPQNTSLKLTPENIELASPLKEFKDTLKNIEKRKSKREMQQVISEYLQSIPRTDHEMRPSFNFSLQANPDSVRDAAIKELMDTEIILLQAQKFGLRVTIGCTFVEASQLSALANTELAQKTSVWQNTTIRGNFDKFKNGANAFGTVLMAISPLFASNGNTNKILAGAGGLFILATPISEIFGVNEDSVKDAMKIIDLSRSEYDNLIIRKKTISKDSARIAALSNALTSLDIRADLYIQSIRKTIASINESKEIPIPLVNTKEIFAYMDSLNLCLVEFKYVANYVGESTDEMMDQVNMYEETYPIHKGSFDNVKKYLREIKSRFLIIKERQLSEIDDITKELTEWKTAVSS